MDEATKEYHLLRWNIYHDAVQEYNHKLSSRFSGIFTILTSAWIIMGAFGLTSETALVSNQSSPAAVVLTTKVESASETSLEDEMPLQDDTPQEDKDSSSNTLLSYIFGLTLAPILLTLLLLHEMRIFIQFQQDNYFMIYHAYELSESTKDSEFGHLLDVTQGSGTPVATFLFMILSNILVLFVPIINILAVTINHRLFFPDHRIVGTASLFINVVCFCAYIAGAVGTWGQYQLLCKKVSPKVWEFSVRNGLKLTGARKARTASPPLRARLALLLKTIPLGRSEAWKNLRGTFPKGKIVSSILRLSWAQKLSFISCVYENWFLSGENKKGILPYIAFLDVTSKCNLKCKGCFASDITEKGTEATSNCHETACGASSPDMKAKDLQKMIPILRRGGVKVLVLTGGEPTLWDDFFQVVIENPDILFLVFTNGQTSLSAHQEILTKLGNLIFIVSIDGEEEAHDKRRGAGTYHTAIRNIEYLKKLKLGFAISITGTKENMKSISGVLDNLKDYKPLAVLIFRYNSDSDSDGLALSKEDYQEHFSCLSRDEYDYPLILLPEDEKELMLQLPEGESACVAGKYIFHIRGDYTISPCPFIRSCSTTSILNMNADEIADLLAEQKGICPAQKKGK